MPTHSETRRLPYTADQMYSLVADVARYHEFLPWTAAARIRDTTDHGDHVVVMAELVISFKVFRERFTSQVTLWPEDRRIDTEYLDGPFKKMVSNWSFTDAGSDSETNSGENACDVGFHVDFEFRNRLLQATATVFFNEAMQRVVRAFERRAEQLYGSAKDQAPKTE